MQMPNEEAIMDVIENALMVIITTASENLLFPIKITAHCPKGFVCAMSIASAGAEPTLSPAEGIPRVIFPITITCIGANGKKMIATIEHPEPDSEGSA